MATAKVFAASKSVNEGWKSKPTLPLFILHKFAKTFVSFGSASVVQLKKSAKTEIAGGFIGGGIVESHNLPPLRHVFYCIGELCNKKKN